MESLTKEIKADESAEKAGTDSHAFSFYQAAFEAYVRPLVLVDLGGEIIAVNAAMTAAFGIQEQDWIGHSVASLFFDPSDFYHFKSVQLDRTQSEAGQTLRTSFHCAGSTPRLVELACVSHFEWRENLRVHLVEVGLAKQSDPADAALRASEKRFRDFVAATSDFLWELDDELRFSYLSPRYFEITNVAPEELLGKTRRQVPLPSLHAHQWQEHLISIEAHEPVREFVFSRIRPDGKRIWLSISGMPVFDDSGKFAGYRGTGQDVTDRVNAEIAMRESEERFRQFADMAADFFWETDPQHFYTRATAHLGDLLGLESEQLIGKSRVEQLLRLDVDPKKLAHHLRQLQVLESFQDFEVGVRHPDGAERRVITSGMPFYDDEGNCLGWRGVGRDITSEWGSRLQTLLSSNS